MFPAAASHADVCDGHWGAPVKPPVNTHREALIPKRADVLAVRIKQWREAPSRGTFISHVRVCPGAQF